jgi:hypothetical protein
VPPFEGLLARRRSRQRRRAAVAGAALSVVGVAAAAVLVAGPGAPTAPDRAAEQPAPPAAPATYSLWIEPDGTVEPNAVEGVDACTELPGTSEVAVHFSSPPKYGLTATGEPARAAVADCVSGVPGWALRLREVAGRPPFVPPAGQATGVRICDTPGGPCVEAGAEAAELLAASLAAPASAPDEDLACFAVYVAPMTVAFRQDGGPLAEATVPRYCGNAVRSDAGPWLLSDAVLAQLERAYRLTASQPTTGVGFTARTEAFLTECLGARADRQVPRFLGLPPDADLQAESFGFLDPFAGEGPATRRVVGRDGVCLDRDDAVDPDRLSLVVVDGVVVSAGAF